MFSPNLDRKRFARFRIRLVSWELMRTINVLSIIQAQCKVADMHLLIIKTGKTVRSTHD